VLEMIFTSVRPVVIWPDQYVLQDDLVAMIAQTIFCHETILFRKIAMNTGRLRKHGSSNGFLFSREDWSGQSA
jgi:hypothetical protein